MTKGCASYLLSNYRELSQPTGKFSFSNDLLKAFLKEDLKNVVPNRENVAKFAHSINEVIERQDGIKENSKNKCDWQHQSLEILYFLLDPKELGGDDKRTWKIEFKDAQSVAFWMFACAV
ncbi:hypothetical protein H0H93_000938 [Arthromyces matolae]|nr:hypothetical protein H0H93_000938 [Arthromyces matolae]